MKTLLIIICILFFISCRHNERANHEANPVTGIAVNTGNTENPAPDSFTLQEVFIDSLHVGQKGENKIELQRFSANDSALIVIKFYNRQHNNHWVVKQQYDFSGYNIPGCDMELSDFNNDGFNDVTCNSKIAARGANEIRRLFIYSRAKNELVYIKNSEDYPNLLFNKELNCIDAFMVYGGSSTVFLKLQGDSLKEFAGVRLDDKLTITETDRYGNEKIIRQDTFNEWRFVRFKNYKPLIPYENF